MSAVFDSDTNICRNSVLQVSAVKPIIVVAMQPMTWLLSISESQQANRGWPDRTGQISLYCVRMCGGHVSSGPKE